MQIIKFYIRANSVLATFVDSANQTVSNIFPSLARGQTAEIVIGFFENEESDTLMTQAQVQQYVSWDFGYDSDYNQETSPKVRTVSGFSVDEDGFLHIPVDTSTAELKTAMGTSETIALSAELDGYLAGDADSPSLIIQWNGQNFRNRILESGTGTPEPAPDGTYTRGQVDALVAGEIIYQFSEDGTNWHDTQTTDDVYMRSRNSAVSTATWSEAIEMPRGQNGEDGAASYVHVAYATNSSGADISLTPTNALKWRAEIANTSPTATTADFADATWVKYIGDDGAGSGDMTKAVCDTNDNGKVDVAEVAETANAVPWTGITGKPDAFTPSAHTHEQAEILDPVTQIFSTSSLGVTELALDTPIVRINGGVTGSISIDIRSIVDADGNTITVEQDKCYTWEYHVLATGTVTSVNVGSEQSTMYPISIPDELPLVQATSTYHVFTIRGFYKSDAVNNIMLCVNYAYSYMA